MMNSVQACGGWPMIASMVVTYGLLALAAAASIKYLFFAGRSKTVS